MCWCTKYCSKSWRYILCFQHHLYKYIALGEELLQGWQTYGMWKDFLAMQHSLLPPIFFFQLTSIFWRIWVYIHISDCVEIVYELLLLQNNTVNETFLHKLGAVWNVHWIFITGAPALWWLGEYVTGDKTFYNLLFKQKVAAAPVTATFSSLSHSLRRPVSEI